MIRGAFYSILDSNNSSFYSISPLFFLHPGLPASTGLWTSWAMAGVAALTGGRGGTVTGVSRSCAVVVAALVSIRVASLLSN